MSLSFNEYQQLSADTRIYPDSARIIYPALGLSNEVGECLGHIKKVIRDGNGEYSEERLQHIKLELSDCLWYFAALCDDFGFNLGDVAQANLDKLQSRKNRGTLQGSGDDR